MDFSTGDNETFHSALVKPAVNINNLREVVVVVADNSKQSQ